MRRVENRDVVCLVGVSNVDFRGNYAKLLQPKKDAERIPVQILDITVAGRRVSKPGARIQVLRTAFANVPEMCYYTMEHPVMAAWAAKNYTAAVIQARIYDVRIREGWSDARAQMMIPVPGNSLASRMYQDLQPWSSDGHITVYTVHPTNYAERGGATPDATLFNIVQGELPHPHVELVMYPSSTASSTCTKPGKPGPSHEACASPTHRRSHTGPLGGVGALCHRCVPPQRHRYCHAGRPQRARCDRGSTSAATS